MYDQQHEHERVSDVSDRATIEETIATGDSIAKQQRAASAYQARYAPREDGECACGCGNEVDPRRLALGFGLTIDCAERLGPRR